MATQYLSSLSRPFVLALAFLASGQNVSPLGHDDRVRLSEFYRLADYIHDRIWPGWRRVPAPLLLVSKDSEYVTHMASLPEGFTRIDNDLYGRARTLPLGVQATFPLFGPPAVIVIGTPSNTASKTSTPWLITVMHEHFHQLQMAQSGYYEALEGLGLARGDKTGSWMLNFPFPYDKPEIADGFAELRDELLAMVTTSDDREFRPLARRYAADRRRFVQRLSADDHKYFEFQLWQEGTARYTEFRAAEEAAGYQPTPEFSALDDFESFASYAGRARRATLDELRRADLPSMKRVVFYSFGAAECLMFDRLGPAWKERYFAHPFSTEGLFSN